MSNHTTPHPIWAILREQGRYNLVWLAERTGYSHGHVKSVAVGLQPAGPRFRAACARLLDLPVSVLFHGATAPGDPPIGESDSTSPVGADLSAVRLR